MPQNSTQNYWQQPAEESTDVQDAIPASISLDTMPSEVVPPPQPAGVQPPGIPVAKLPAAKPHIEWQAAEFVEHSKGPLWFVVFALFGIAVLYLGIFLLKDWFVSIGFVIMLLALGKFALRQPRILKYSISDDGIHVGETLYHFADFQSFSVQRDGQAWMLHFLPTARFKPALITYFSEDQGEAIVDVLGKYLPMEDRKPDMLDRLSTKMRF